MPTPPASKTKRALIRRAFKEHGGNVSATSRATGIAKENIVKYTSDLKVKPADPVKTAEERLASARELARERVELQAVAGERSFRAYVDGLIRDVCPQLDSPPRFKEPKRQAGSTTEDESLVLLLSDWHAYEIVKPERVLGLNEFNADVLARRTWRIIDSANSIVSRLRQGGWRFPRLIVAANGDMISGTIHEVERHSDAPNVIRAAIGCGILLAQCLRDLAANFEEVEVFGTSGNHGRLRDHKRVSQKDPSRSWDYLIYSIARQSLADLPNVRFTLPDSYSAVYEVEGWRFYQGHGHDVKSWQSIPFYGISRTATGLNALRVAAGSPIHYFLFSHFHNPGSIAAPWSEYFVNGSLIGGTEVQCKRPRPGGQAMPVDAGRSQGPRDHTPMADLRGRATTSGQIQRDTVGGAGVNWFESRGIPRTDGGDSVILAIPDVRQSEDYDCGAAAVVAVCRYFRRLHRQLPLPGGTSTKSSLLSSAPSTAPPHLTPPPSCRSGPMFFQGRSSASSRR